MDHEAFEKEMIDHINRKTEEKSKPAKAKPKVFTKKDGEALKMGFVRTMFSLFTTAVFAVAVMGFIAVGVTPGYLAVFLFIASLATAVSGVILLYAQGILGDESRGESK